MTRTMCTAPALGPEQTPLERELREVIRGLPFGAVAALIRQLLVQMGYSGVCVRRTRQHGHNQHVLGPGGWDLEGWWETGLSRERLICQLKHGPEGPAVLARPVQMRFVDELRGAMLRANALHGLLVTTGTFSGQARRAALTAGENLTLVDGDALVGLLRAYKVGLKQDAYGEWSLNEALLARLRRLFPPEHARAGERDAEEGGRGAGGAARAPHPAQASPLTLTVITTALLRPLPGSEDRGRKTRP